MKKFPRHFQVLCLGVIASLTGCARSLDVQVKAGNCLNPMQAPCKDAAFDSRPVEVRFYPLNACPPKGSPRWADLLDPDEARQALGPLRLGGEQTLSIERGEQRLLTFAPLPKGTTCVLAVVIGRGEGERSVRTFPVEKRKGLAKFKLETYDLLAPVKKTKK